MQYQFAQQDQDYADYASGRVFYSLPGHPAFPVRLASEVFQRCLAHRQIIYGASSPCTVYDPCCGAAYHLAVLAYLHPASIKTIFASDVSEKAVSVANRNLSLLHSAGLDARIAEIRQMIDQYGKESHQQALHSALRLKEMLAMRQNCPAPEVFAFEGSAFNQQKMLAMISAQQVDIVFTDVPYGQHVHWQMGHDAAVHNPLAEMLGALHGVLSSASVVAVASDKQQKVAHAGYQRVAHFQLGKRRVVILQPI